MRVMERLRARWMSSPSFEILTFANEFLNCCNRYRNEPLGADKNSLDWWKAKKEEYLMLARLAVCFLKDIFVNTEHLHLPVIVWILDAN